MKYNIYPYNKGESVPALRQVVTDNIPKIGDFLVISQTNKRYCVVHVERCIAYSYANEQYYEKEIKVFVEEK